MTEEHNETNETPVNEVKVEGQEVKNKTGETQKADPNLKGAWKQVENIGQAIGDALQGRGNVVMVRVNDEALRHLDMLVEAEVVKSRSEAAALLINEGIQANDGLFNKISDVTTKIAALREQLRETVKNESMDSNK
ncbi:MAG: hypothetical protein CL609_18390 [Anaerolineaceae bacterium]|nr:hypothetical protein [Anaerolineaceae bacterium]